MTAGRALRLIPETFFLCLAFLVIPWLPRRCVLRLAHAMGSLAYRLDRRSRKVGRANLDLVFGAAVAESVKEAWLLESCRSFALVTLDLFWFGFRTRQRIRDYVYRDETLAPLDHPPVIVVSGHLGNWEILGQVTGSMGRGVLSVGAPLDNPLVDWALRRLRRHGGQRTTRKQGALRSLYRSLRSGVSVGLVADQNVVPRDGGEFIEVFGVPALVATSAARLAERTGAPVVVAVCLKEPDGTYRVRAREPLRFPDGGDTLAFTHQIELLLEAEIRKYPAAWLWSYKRWHYRLESMAADRFPWYTRVLPPAKMRRGGVAGEIGEGENA